VIPAPSPIVRVGAALSRHDETVGRLVADRVASRLFEKDAALWGPEAEPEARVRLGWVDAWVRSEPLLAEVAELRDSLRTDGIDRVVLCGMGGSSLGPEVIARHSGVDLFVLDSTHPSRVRGALVDLLRTVVVVSSKSGSTVETRSHLEAFEAAFSAEGIESSERIVVVTDPGSPLETHARRSGYRVFLADPDVGGRYSVFTAFGLVPSVLACADFAALLSEAREASVVLRADSSENPALVLAAALSADLPNRYVCCTVEDGAAEKSEDDDTHLAGWIEQLVAESTGKQGLGVLPIALQSDSYEIREALPRNAVAVRLGFAPEPDTAEIEGRTIAVSGTLGAQLLLWEVATAVLGMIIGVNPFDQPDVESAKAAARALLHSDASDSDASGSGTSDLGTSDLGASDLGASNFGALNYTEETRFDAGALLAELRAAVTPESYVAIQAYLDDEAAAPLADLRERLAEALGVPVALGFGPRYLHSTGQFHKGGPALGVFLQVLDTPSEGDATIHGIDFGALISAQARGDRGVLEQHGRPVLALPAARIAAIIAALPGG
jgi:glucose-6-phosphate isomerase